MSIQVRAPSCASRAVLSALLLGSASPALAQVATTPPPPPADAAGTGAADAGQANAGADPADIIVTATKRNERLQDVPVSVVALAPETLARTGTLDASQLPNLTPGLSFTTSGQPKLASFYVRGVGTYALSPSLESSVGVAVDGVPLARINSISDLVDVDHVEVLKGPQGTLFGKNATAGLISIVTRKPEVGDDSAVAHVSYGSYDELNLDTTVNYSPSDKGAFRLTAWRYGHDGFVRGNDGREYDDKNTYGVRAGVTIKPADTLDVTLIGEYSGRDEHGIAQTLRDYGPKSNPGVIAYNNAVGYFPDPRNDRVARLYFPSYTRANNIAITGLVDLDVGGGYTLSSITSYRDVNDKSQFDVIGTDAPAFHVFELPDFVNYDQFTEELRIASPAERRLSFVAGLFYYDFSIRDVQRTGLFAATPGGSVSFDRKTAITDYLKDYAVFGDATFRILDGWRLIAGARQSHDRTGGSLNRTRVGTDQLLLPGGITELLSFTARPVKYDFTSYRFGTQVDVARDVMLYATASRGYKGPGFNFSLSTASTDLRTDGQPNNALVRPETARSYEAGIKSQFFDRRLTVNVTGFHSVFKNFQTTTTPPVVPSQFTIANAKELQSDGVEFEVTARPVHGLSLGVNGAYIDARYTDYKNGQCYDGQPSLPAGSPFPSGACVAGVQNLDGVQVAASPKWSANANARYDASFGGDWHGFLGTDYSYRSRQLFDQQNDPKVVQPGYGVFNLNAGVGPQDERWTVSLYVRNAFDKYFVNRIRNGNGFYLQLNAYEAQRRVGGQLELKF